jgi:class 3 adenylate cyclase
VVVQSPSGTVTFLLTDIEDSTRLWESNPTGMAEAVQAHDAIVRSAIGRHGGYVFATNGDGFLRRLLFRCGRRQGRCRITARTG